MREEMKALKGLCSFSRPLTAAAGPLVPDLGELFRVTGTIYVFKYVAHLF